MWARGRRAEGSVWSRSPWRQAAAESRGTGGRLQADGGWEEGASQSRRPCGLGGAGQVMTMADIAKNRRAHSLKKEGSVSALSSHEFRRKEHHGRIKDCVSTVSYMDEPSQHDLASHLTVQMENTYQLGPTKHFPVVTVNHILKDVLTNYLQEKQYDPELCRQMTKTISEVIKAQVKDLMIPRYKLIVMVHMGPRHGQSILIGSRCLWNPKSDTFASYVFRNSSLFALANVYAVYFE